MARIDWKFVGPKAYCRKEGDQQTSSQPPKHQRPPVLLALYSPHESYSLYAPPKCRLLSESVRALADIPAFVGTRTGAARRLSRRPRSSVSPYHDYLH